MRIAGGQAITFAPAAVAPQVVVEKTSPEMDRAVARATRGKGLDAMSRGHGKWERAILETLERVR